MPRVTGPTLHNGDCLDVLADMAPASIDAFVDDPPAGIAFMGRAWDDLRGYKPRTALGRYVLATYGGGAADAVEAAGMVELAGEMRARALPGWAAGFLAFMAEVAAAKLRVAKPGAMGVSWALPRTSDLTMLALRLAGWEIAEPVVHLFGGGFPKSLDVGKAIDKMHGSERRKVHATGGLHKYANMNDDGWSNVGKQTPMMDGCEPATEDAQRWAGWGTALSPAAEYWIIYQAPLAAMTPERVREATGLDYLWSSRTIKPSELRAEAKRFAGIGDHLCGPMPDVLTGWGEMIRIAAAHHMLESPARAYRSAHESWLRQWLVLGMAGVMSPLMVEVLLMSEPREPSPWVRWTGRSTRRGHCGRLQLRLDGAVVHDIDGAPFSKSKIKTIAANVLVHGTGALNIDATRTHASGRPAREHAEHETDRNTYSLTSGSHAVGETDLGRWPKNAVLSCALACVGRRHSPACPRTVLDEMSGTLHGRGNCGPEARGAGSGHVYGGGWSSDGEVTEPRRDDGGGASRYFPTFGYYPKASDRSIPGREDITNTHPTHKSPELMRWLVRIVTPPGGRVLDSFMGSGTTGVACAAEGVEFEGVEADPDNFAIARSRILAAVGCPEYAAEVNAAAAEGAQLALL